MNKSWPPIGATGIPLPAALATPGPPGANLSPSSGGGGPSMVMLTTESPLSTINPKLLFSSFSSVIPFRQWRSLNNQLFIIHYEKSDPSRLSIIINCITCPFFDFILLYSSVSPSTIFMCLSKAINVPTNMRLDISRGWRFAVRSVSGMISF